jgi:uncharacterized protein (DUF2141 family)
MTLPEVLALWLLLPTAALTAQQTIGNEIRVDVGGLRSGKGQVMCALYSSADGFAKDGGKALANTSSRISNGQAVCSFNNMVPGTYAVAIIHDENSNGKLDTNFMGIPKEGVGASNNAKGHFGPPKFQDAAFQFSGGHLAIKIAMTYY